MRSIRPADQSPGKSPGRNQPRQRNLQQSASPQKRVNDSRDMDDYQDVSDEKRVAMNRMAEQFHDILGSGKSLKNGNNDLQALRISLEEEAKGNYRVSPPDASGQSSSNKSFKDFLLQNKESRR